MREDIEFNAEGATLRGWFYRPDDTRGEVPCIVMSHGFSAIKEMHLDEYAEVFCDAGLACLVYDNRGLGESDAAPGKPRQEIDPWEQIRDYQHAITYAQMRPEVDANRIAVARATPLRTPTSPPRSTAASRRSVARCRSSPGGAPSRCSCGSIFGSRPGSCSPPTAWPARVARRPPCCRSST